MRESDNRGLDRDSRSSALWGTGGRGGDSRSSALWGKGGRGFVLTAIAVFALAAPIASSAGGNWGGASGDHNKSDTWVQTELSNKAKTNPNEMVRVIVTSNYGGADAETKSRALGSFARFGKKLNLVDGVSMQLPAKYIPFLQKFKGLTVTVDAPQRTSGLTGTSVSYPTSDQLWPYESGNSILWGTNVTLPTIAIVDSGIEKGRADFNNGARVLADVSLVNADLANTNSAGDGRGHGTFVAGIAAGAAAGKAGAAPKANLVSVDVMNDQGMAYTSDVIAACNWVLQNQTKYNIKVANFSLHSTRPSNFGHDPLDKAVEKLWFSGITVVAAAGNYGNSDGTPSGVKYAPGNDPFVITVGAVDLGDSARPKDDSVAPWSAWGRTYDGFLKPEIGAAGRYMVAPVPTNSTLYKERPEKIVKPGYMELSGTSFAAPVVAGTAAYLMAMHPTWGPDQVKGALMKSARAVPLAKLGQAGVGELNAVAAAVVKNAPNPNKALRKFVVADPTGGTVPVFDDVSWYDVAKSDVSWDSVSWADVSWLDVSWLDVSWADVSWSDVSWLDVSWSDVSWADVSWLDGSREDAVGGEPGVGEGMPLDAADAAELAADPALQVDLSLLPGAVDVLTTTTAAVAPVAATTAAVAPVTATVTSTLP